MSDVSITFPKRDMPNPILGAAFVASGFASPDIIGVVGACKARSGQGHHVRGTLIDFKLLTSGSKKGSYLWLIGFTVDPAVYELEVVGHSHSGHAAAKATVSVEVVAAPAADIERPFDLTNVIPAPNTDITDDLCSGNFAVSGVVPGLTTVGDVRLAAANSPNNNVEAIEAVVWPVNPQLGLLYAPFDSVPTKLDPDHGEPESLVITIYAENNVDHIGDIPVRATLPCSS